ncbi:hypothetical protein ACHAWO_005355 [Cyclotella atomus]|uniref:Uncharacterized protein n=1 Tax=Cyclotella atomus TaxID=382360 RepID=A0ABD3Q4N1_9STRA
MLVTAYLYLCIALSISCQYAIAAPFIFKSKPHKSAAKAYLERLQNELESAQRQLYTSQKTCIALKKRVNDQRRESLRRNGAAADGDVISIGNNEDQSTIQQQDEEIAQLRSRLDTETQKVKEQAEQMKLLEAELKDVQQWKEKQENDKSSSTMSDHVQHDYEQQIEMLSLKLEAAELAAKMRGSDQSDSSAGKRSNELKSELESVRQKYAKLSIQLMNASAASGEKSVDKQKVLEEDMDIAIQSVFHAALESVEEEWEEKYQQLQSQIEEITQYTADIEDERDTALRRLKEDSSVDDEHDLKEKLANELTSDLTDKIREQLTKELTAKIEKRLRKKYKKLQKELHSQTSGSQEQMMQSEIDKVKEQYEAEYAMKLQEVQQQNEEQLAIQKEKMRKLVRALLEREAKEKKSSKTDKVNSYLLGSSGDADQKVKKKRKRRDRVSKSDDEVITTSSMSSSVKPAPGVAPFRGNAIK